jgi:hypothetical protein
LTVILYTIDLTVVTDPPDPCYYTSYYILKYILYFQDSNDDSSGNAEGTRESHETTGYVKVSTKPLRNCKNMRIEYDILPRRGSHGKSHYVIET